MVVSHAMYRPAGNMRWPDRVGLILPLYVPVDNKPSLAAVTFLIWDRSSAEFIYIDSRTGNKNDIYEFLTSKEMRGNQLVACGAAFQTLTAMGFWELIRDGEIRLAGEDYRDKEKSSVCVVAGDPFVLNTHIPKKAHHWIIDLNNWGYTGVDYKQEVGKKSLSELMAEFHTASIVHVLEFLEERDALLTECNLGQKYCMTNASQAFYGFRLNYLKSDILVPESEEVERLSRESLFGGRNECFFIGKYSGPVKQYDYNQLYGYVASFLEVPVECTEDRVSDFSALGNPEKAADYIAEVLVSIDRPLLPFRTTLGDKRVETIYPIGSFRTTLAGPELAYAARIDAIKEVYAAVKFRRAPIFKDWARKLWQARCLRRGTSNERSVKSIALSLYGKFCQKRNEWILVNDALPAPMDMEVGDWFEWDESSESVVRYRVLGSTVQREECGGYMWNSFPAISCYIASMARLLLLDILLEVWDSILYCDTDSVFVTADGAKIVDERFRDDGALGGLRFVASHKWMRIDGLRHYETDCTAVNSGVPAKAERTGTRYDWQEHATFKSFMEQRDYPKTLYTNRHTRKYPRYRHGTVGEDGRVTPIVVMDG